MKKKPTPKVVKRTRKDGTPVTTEYHVYQDGFINDGLDGTHINIPEPEAFDEQVIKVLLKTTPKRDLDRLERHFTKAKPRKTRKDKTFPQFLINLEGKEEEFASRLRAVFSGGRGRQIRYMIEALRELKLLTFGNREGESLYQSMVVYFNRAIGAKTGIFDPKYDELGRDNIDAAIDRINSILKDLFSSK